MRMLYFTLFHSGVVSITFVLQNLFAVWVLLPSYLFCPQKWHLHAACERLETPPSAKGLNIRKRVKPTGTKAAEKRRAAVEYTAVTTNIYSPSVTFPASCTPAPMDWAVNVATAPLWRLLMVTERSVDCPRDHALRRRMKTISHAPVTFQLRKSL